MSTQRFSTFDGLDWNQLKPFQKVALMIAFLAFPDPNEIALRRRAFEALCADYVREKCREHPDEAAEWRANFAIYAAIDARESRRRLRTLARRLRDRMKAAQMALGYFDEAIRYMLYSFGETYPDLKEEIGNIDLRSTPLPDAVPRHSLNALVAIHYPRSNEEGRHNQEQRVWRISLSVIDLAVAFYVLGRQLKSGDTFFYPLDDLDLHRRVFALAEIHENALHCEWERRRAGGKGSSTFVIDPNVLIPTRTEKSATSGF